MFKISEKFKDVVYTMYAWLCLQKQMSELCNNRYKIYNVL